VIHGRNMRGKAVAGEGAKHYTRARVPGVVFESGSKLPHSRTNAGARVLPGEIGILTATGLHIRFCGLRWFDPISGLASRWRPKT
jgi:hypothetical protein